MLLLLLWALLVSHLLLALLLCWHRLWAPWLDPAPLRPSTGSGRTEPSVLIVVPARNEEAHIGACVQALLAQRYQRFSVRVVNDHSTDRTAEVVREIADRDHRLQLMQAPDLPPGWLGKPHALHAGTAGATADYLLFVDADLRLAPDALARAVATVERRRAGLLTVVPELVCGSFWERAVQPVVGTLIFGLLIDPMLVSSPRSRRASANGPFLLFSRAAYERIGGHACVAGEVVEDLRLAQAVKRAGLRLCYCNGTDVARLRMYDSLRAILSGWGKNCLAALAPLGTRLSLALAPLCALGLLWLFLGPTLAALAVVISWALGYKLYSTLAVIALGSYAADWLCRLSLRWNYRVTLRGVRGLGGAAVAYILCGAALRAATGRTVSWRGRALPTAAGGPAR